MFEKILAEQNKQWNEIEIYSGIQREKNNEILPYLDKKQVLVITGIRRCGKSYLLKQIQQHLIKNGEHSKNILFLNLENPYFDEFRNKVIYLDKIFEEYKVLTNVKGKIYVLLDEIQFFNHWQVFVKSKYELENVKFILTGSNSWLLSSEYSTLLSGRTIHFELFPFSFKEFLKIKNFNMNERFEIFLNEVKITKFFEEYMIWGGFPDVVLNNSEEQKKEILLNYYNNIIYRDVIPRFNISNIRQAGELVQYLISNIGKCFSFNKMASLIGISDKTVKEYINYFSQAYLFFEINKYSHSIKKQMINQKKIYVGDVGFTKALGFRASADIGRFLENTILIELKRQKKEVYYYTGKKECDFIARDKNNKLEAIQVCFELNEENEKKEIEGLKEAMNELKIKNGLIITFNQEKNFGKTKAIPAWKWLLKL